MSQIYIPFTGSSPIPPVIPTSFVTDNGVAIPAVNILNVLGGDGATTSGSGNTITITVDGTAPSYVNVVGPQTYVVTATDYFISCDTTLGVVTIQLPNAPTLYDQFVIKDRTGTAPINNVIVTTVGGAILIDGSTSYTFTDAYESLELLFSTKYESF